MKTSLNILCAAAAALLCGCAKEEKSESAEQEQITLSATFSTSPSAEIKSEHQTESRATATAFEANDELGLFVVKSGMEVQKDGNLVNNHKMVVGSDGVIKGTPTAVYYPSSSAQTTSPTSQVTIHSYYPYQSGDATADALGVLVGIRTDQTDFLDVKRSDLCFGSARDITPAKTAQPITFKHSFAQVRVNVALFAGCPAIKQLRLINVKDSATLNMQTGAISLKSHTAEVLAYKSAENSYSTIIPAQTLNGACIAIDLVDNKTTYIYNAIDPINLTQSATNTLNLTINDKGVASLNGTPSVTTWTTATSSGMMNSAINNQISLYWLAPHSDYATADKITLSTTDPLGVTRDIDLTPTLDPTSSPDYAIYKLNLSLSGATYPLVVNKIRVYKGATLLCDCFTSAVVGTTLSKSGVHTLGINLWVKVSSPEDWLNVSAHGASKTITINTYGTSQWVATTSDPGVTVTPQSGSTGQSATIAWSYNATSQPKTAKVSIRTEPFGVETSINTSQLAGTNQTVIINGLKWTTGNLVANGDNSCRVGAPTDGGLYFQFGSLIGWTGGANGDGTGVPAAGNPTVPVLSIKVKPAAHTGSTSWNAAWTGDAKNQNEATGTGDPCRYYLGSPWRLPMAHDFQAVANYSVWTTNGATSGRWYGPTSDWSAANAVWIPAVGNRTAGNGAITGVGIGAILWSSGYKGTNDGYYCYINSSRVGFMDYGNMSYGHPVRCVQNVPTTPTPPTADQIVIINGLKWTKGNLVANGGANCKVGQPGDGGLYFQFGGLIGYKGGAYGDGRSMPLTPAGSPYSTNEVVVTPTGYSKSIESWPTFINTSSGGYGYYYYNNGLNFKPLSNQPNNTNITLAIGDPCAIYLGSPWRLPIREELFALPNNVTNPSSWADCPTAKWVDTPIKGGWFGADAKSANPTTSIFVPATGRYSSDGYRQLTYEMICLHSSTYYVGGSVIITCTQNEVSSPYYSTREWGYNVRCVSN